MHAQLCGVDICLNFELNLYVCPNFMYEWVPEWFLFNIPPAAKVIWRLGNNLSLIQHTEGARDQTRDHCVQGEWFIHYTIAAPIYIMCAISEWSCKSTSTKNSCAGSFNLKNPSLDIKDDNLNHKLFLLFSCCEIDIFVIYFLSMYIIYLFHVSFRHKNM